MIGKTIHVLTRKLEIVGTLQLGDSSAKFIPVSGRKKTIKYTVSVKRYLCSKRSDVRLGIDLLFEGFEADYIWCESVPSVIGENRSMLIEPILYERELVGVRLHLCKDIYVEYTDGFYVCKSNARLLSTPYNGVIQQEIDSGPDRYYEKHDHFNDAMSDCRREYVFWRTLYLGHLAGMLKDEELFSDVYQFVVDKLKER